MSPALAGGCLTTSPPGKSLWNCFECGFVVENSLGVCSSQNLSDVINIEGCFLRVEKLSLAVILISSTLAISFHFL